MGQYQAVGGMSHGGRITQNNFVAMKKKKNKKMPNRPFNGQFYIDNPQPWLIRPPQKNHFQEQFWILSWDIRNGQQTS